MKVRWLWFLICAVGGLVLLIGGLLVPRHLRAVDASVIAKAGANGPALVEEAQTLADEHKLGAAQMIMEAARLAGIPGWNRLAEVIANQERQNPTALTWGNDSREPGLFGDESSSARQNLLFTDFIVHQANRDAALEHLRASPIPAVQELLQSRSLNDTVLFPPSSSASGQAFDAAVCITGLLLDGNHLTPSLSGQIYNLASRANRGASSEPMEQALMDFMSLGQRFNWDQLTAFVAGIPGTGALSQLASEARAANEKLPVLFAAVQLSGKPADVGAYLAKFPNTGLSDLEASLRYGAGGVSELAQSGQRFYNPTFEQHVTAYNPFGAFFDCAANVCYRSPWLALAAKWFLYLTAGFLLAAALHFARPAVAPLERPLQVRGFHLVREFLFSLAFLLVVLLLSEPFLAQENQRESFSLRPHLPTVGGAVTAGMAGIKQTVMNPTILLTLLVFFVLQSLLYISCLVKLAEIRRQNVPPRMKLRLLENEDHLFDAGLYLGFVGTIVSLIIASLGLVKFSLMAAYSSTSFGIIFVVIFK
ncbi:MAG TPA: hypothetical protein VMA13_01050, partial [Candidatus Saccharimonadales bacterium]|nr:hypothetical protein [Candidatus Saccharimonadales bacterium]